MQVTVRRTTTSDVLWVCAFEVVFIAMAPKNARTAVMSLQTVAVRLFF